MVAAFSYTMYRIANDSQPGKSTLADRLLELTGTIPAAKNGERNKQVLDTLKVERERGITVRAMSASYV
jgi:translation elongation factor EF-4